MIAYLTNRGKVTANGNLIIRDYRFGNYAGYTTAIRTEDCSRIDIAVGRKYTASNQIFAQIEHSRSWDFGILVSLDIVPEEFSTVIDELKICVDNYNTFDGMGYPMDKLTQEIVFANNKYQIVHAHNVGNSDLWVMVDGDIKIHLDTEINTVGRAIIKYDGDWEAVVREVASKQMGWAGL